VASFLTGNGSKLGEATLDLQGTFPGEAIRRATPCQRLFADPRTNEEVRRRVQELRAALDPVRLLKEIRTVQQQLVGVGVAALPGRIALRPGSTSASSTELGLERLISLAN
jgi:hypothetical protein